VALLVSGVLGDEVEVLAADDDSSVHLGGNDGAGQDTATDRDETGEGALLVCRAVSMTVPDIPPRFACEVPASNLGSIPSCARSRANSHIPM
jgi:hypothetical protein